MRIGAHRQTDQNQLREPAGRRSARKSQTQRRRRDSRVPIGGTQKTGSRRWAPVGDRSETDLQHRRQRQQRARVRRVRSYNAVQTCARVGLAAVVRPALRSRVAVEVPVGVRGVAVEKALPVFVLRGAARPALLGKLMERIAHRPDRQIDERE